MASRLRRINGRAIDFGALGCGYTPVDLDTFAIDSCKSQIVHSALVHIARIYDIEPH